MTIKKQMQQHFENKETPAHAIPLAPDDCSQCVKLKTLTNTLLSALELCLESDCLPWDAEQEAEKAVEQVMQFIASEVRRDRRS